MFVKFATPISGALCAFAFLLTVLSLIAGSREGVLEDWAIVTVSLWFPVPLYVVVDVPQLNTSCIGEDVVDKIPSGKVFRRENPLTQMTNANGLPKVSTPPKAAPLTHVVAGALPTKTVAVASQAQSIGDSVESGLEDAAGDLAKALGLQDFYSAHLMNYCEGYFMPGSVPNASISQNSIIKNVTACSNVTITHLFDPQAILQQQLSSGSVSIADLHWPNQITTGLSGLENLQRAMVILYLVAASFMFIALVCTSTVLCCCPCGLGSVVITIAELVAAVTLCIGAAMVTLMAVKSADLINAYGSDIGISAAVGHKFLVFTWMASGAICAAVVI